jgi:beta-lactamase regulating signal transducer with metallopeptidase domain
MGVGVSLLLIAGGAILAWAVNVTTTGVNVNTIGYILLVVGIIGLLLSLVFWSSWAGPGYFTRTDRPRRRVIEEDV